MLPVLPVLGLEMNRYSESKKRTMLIKDKNEVVHYVHGSIAYPICDLYRDSAQHLIYNYEDLLTFKKATNETITCMGCIYWANKE